MNDSKKPGILALAAGAVLTFGLVMGTVSWLAPAEATSVLSAADSAAFAGPKEYLPAQYVNQGKETSQVHEYH